MAGEQQEAPWPIPQFHFSVVFEEFNSEIGFSEVTGLDIEAQVIEYRTGDSEDFSTVKMPGLVQTSNLTLKRGVFKGDNAMFEWFQNIAMNTIARQTIQVNLLDETHAPVVTWTLRNAFPTKITYSDMKSDANEVAIDTLEIAHEGLNEVVYS